MIRAGKWTMAIALVLMALCTAPIMLYAMFGPADGNPVGLGMLMVFGTLGAALMLLVGLALWFIGIVREKKAA
jgi:hypothetical protein